MIHAVEQQLSSISRLLLLFSQAEHTAIEAFVAGYIGPEARGWMVPGVAMPPDLIRALGVAVGRQPSAEQVLCLELIEEQVCVFRHRVVSTRVSVALNRLSTAT